MSYFKSLFALSVFLLVSSLHVLAQNEPPNQNSIQVFDYNIPEQLREYEAMNLDASHTNLLDPSASEEDINAVITSWSEFHQSLNNYLSEHDFKWKLNSGTNELRIVHKIYFESSGSMKQYFFRVLSNEVSKQNREDYAKLVNDFAMEHRINFNMETPFAQCGKTKTVLE